MDSKWFDFHKLVEERHGNICEIVGMKDGETVYEDCWHDFKPDNSLNVMSVTKSVTSLLVGIAIDKGFIGGVEQRVLDFFPDYTVKRGEKTIQHVTLRHLLTMTAPYKYRSEPWTKVCTSEDWTVAALDILGGKAGITGEFKYATLGSHILTGIIAKASGMPVIDFANEYLFEPLGIPAHRNASVETKEAQYEYLMSKAPKESVWLADDVGVNTAGWGLCLSARDMAKIGLMCLNRGMYNGAQVVSPGWIDASTRPYFKCDERFANMSYGYMWWIIDEASHTYAAIGDGGNVIYVNPAQNTVVGVTATFKPRVFDRVQLIQEQIEPLL